MGGGKGGERGKGGLDSVCAKKIGQVVSAKTDVEKGSEKSQVMLKTAGGPPPSVNAVYEPNRKAAGKKDSGKERDRKPKGGKKGSKTTHTHAGTSGRRSLKTLKRGREKIGKERGNGGAKVTAQGFLDLGVYVRERGGRAKEFRREYGKEEKIRSGSR